MWAFLHRFASPPHFYRLSGRIAPWLGWTCLGLMVGGLYGGLVAAPPDYQQGESYRIIFVHVPSAWMSMFVYVVMAGRQRDRPGVADQARRGGGHPKRTDRARPSRSSP